MASYWDRFTGARISRRRLLQSTGTAGAAAAAFALVGCSSGSSSPSASPTARADSGRPDQPDILNPADPPRRGGTLVTANSANFGTFDPHLGIEVASAYFPRVYNVLLSQSATKPGFIFWDLAESYEAPDPETYIFKIRPGVKVAPNELGVPERDLDAEDVRLSFERLRTDATTNGYGFASQYIRSVTASGDTVTFKTPGPYAWFVQRIGSYLHTVAPRELLAGDQKRMADKTAGAGAYRLVSLSEGDAARFEVNPNYYRKDEATGEQLPYIESLDVRTIFDRTTQRTAFQSGQIHLYWTATGAEARSMGDAAVIARDPNFAFISFTMRPDRKPFDDPRVRRAISRAIDREPYVQRVYGGDAKENGLVHWPLGPYALDESDLRSTYQPYDVADARALVEAVGGISFKMMYPAGTSIEEHGDHLPIFVEQMRAAGIDVTEDPLDFGTWVDSYHARNYTSSLALNQVYETPELPLAFHTAGGPFGDKTYIAGIGDAEIDAAVRKANATADEAERITAVHDAQKLIYAKEPMFLPLVSPYQHYAWSKRVKNIPAGIGTTSYSVTTYWLDT